MIYKTLTPYALIFIFLFVGCGSKTNVTSKGGSVESYNVYKNNKKVLFIKNEPGIVTSDAPPPPTATPPMKHPFLSGESLDNNEAENISKLLEQAKSFNEFVELLKKNGYRLEPGSANP